MPSNNLPKKHYTECKNQFKVHRNKTVWDLAQHLLQTGLCEPFEAYLLAAVIILYQEQMVSTSFSFRTQKPIIPSICHYFS